MRVRWQIRLFDPSTGSQVAVFDDTGGYWAFGVSRKLNSVGLYTFRLRGDDERVDLFDLDAIVEFRRSVELNGETLLDWYTEAGALHRAKSAELKSDLLAFISTGVSYEDFLDRRGIWYLEGSAGASKSGPAETVMKDFVAENLGSSATTGNGRLDGGVMTGLSVETDGASGSTWEGDRAFQSLLNVLQEIALVSGLNFRIVRKTGATFEFQTFAGVDRSIVGLDHSTGLNGAGNVPIIFSAREGTLSEADYDLDRLDEITAALALGRGEGDNLTWKVKENAGRLDDSPWNRREAAASATTQQTADALDVEAQALLDGGPIKEAVTFDVVQTKNRLYGLDYFLGDVMTVRFEDAGVAANVRLVSVTIGHSSDGEGKEKLAHEFEEAA